MYDYADIKQFITNINKTARIFTDGKFNSSDLAIFDAIKNEPKNVHEIADRIGMSHPSISSSLYTHVRRKYVKLIPEKSDGKLTYQLNDDFNIDVLEEVLEPLNEEERKQFMGFINRLNEHMSDVICYAKLNE